MPIPGPICPYCKGMAVLCGAEVVYGAPYKDRFLLWVCRNYPECDSYVGVHANSYNAAPMGSLANAQLRKLRRVCHEKFDTLWKSGAMKRNQAYRKLEQIMGREKGKAHIASFTEEQCLKAIMGLVTPEEAREAREAAAEQGSLL